MGFVTILIIGAILGYIYASRFKPNNDVKELLQELRVRGEELLEGGRKGVYKTIVTDQQASSELVVEIKELATTTAGQVKIQYLTAFYKNPDFRTRKGEALLEEVRNLLGEYLPQQEIEWYDSQTREENLRQFLATLEAIPNNKRLLK